MNENLTVATLDKMTETTAPGAQAADRRQGDDRPSFFDCLGDQFAAAVTHGFSATRTLTTRFDEAA